MILISDESGDVGCSYINHASNFYIISYALIDGNGAINFFVDSAFRASKSIFGKSLTSWKQLNSQIKSNPDIQKRFLEELFSNLTDKNFYYTLGFFIINKSELEERISRDKDKKLIQYHAYEGYRLILKRILPFLKCLHYTAKRYPSLPNLEWYIDINNKEFQRVLHEHKAQLAREHRVNINGPKFISKKKDFDRQIVHAITVVDVIGGIVNKAMEQYSKCNCIKTNCFDCDCENTFKSIWESILKRTTNLNVLYKGNIFWNWQGIQYVPISNRNKHSRFFTKDIFTD